MAKFLDYLLKVGGYFVYIIRRESCYCVYDSLFNPTDSWKKEKKADCMIEQRLLWMPPAAIKLCNTLKTYEGDHYWEFIYFGNSNQMVLYWDNQPVFIFEVSDED